MRPDRAVFSLLSCGLLLPLTASAAAPSTYAAVVGTKTAYGLTVTGNILVGRTRKPMAVYQDVQFKVRGVIHEEILESSVRDGLLIRLGYEHGSMTARLAGVETGLFEYFARPFIPSKDEAVTLRIGPRGGVLALLPSGLDIAARQAAAILSSCLRPPLPPGGLRNGSSWQARLPSPAGAVLELEALFLKPQFKAGSSAGGAWTLVEDAGTMDVMIQDGSEGTPATFSARGEVGLLSSLRPQRGRFTTELRRKGPEAAPPEKCDILIEAKGP